MHVRSSVSYFIYKKNVTEKKLEFKIKYLKTIFNIYFLAIIYRNPYFLLQILLRSHTIFTSKYVAQK